MVPPAELIVADNSMKSSSNKERAKHANNLFVVPLCAAALTMTAYVCLATSRLGRKYVG